MMVFNPLFIQKQSFEEGKSTLKPSKFQNSNYIFSDIIKVYNPDEQDAAENATQKATGTSVSSDNSSGTGVPLTPGQISDMINEYAQIIGANTTKLTTSQNAKVNSNIQIGQLADATDELTTTTVSGLNVSGATISLLENMNTKPSAILINPSLYSGQVSGSEILQNKISGIQAYLLNNGDSIAGYTSTEGQTQGTTASAVPATAAELLQQAEQSAVAGNVLKTGTVEATDVNSFTFENFGAGKSGTPAVVVDKNGNVVAQLIPGITVSDASQLLTAVNNIVGNVGSAVSSSADKAAVNSQTGAVVNGAENKPVAAKLTEQASVQTNSTTQNAAVITKATASTTDGGQTPNVVSAAITSATGAEAKTGKQSGTVSNDGKTILENADAAATSAAVTVKAKPARPAQRVTTAQKPIAVNEATAVKKKVKTATPEVKHNTDVQTNSATTTDEKTVDKSAAKIPTPDVVTAETANSAATQANVNSGNITPGILAAGQTAKENVTANTAAATPIAAAQATTGKETEAPQPNTATTYTAGKASPGMHGPMDPNMAGVEITGMPISEEAGQNAVSGEPAVASPVTGNIAKSDKEIKDAETNTATANVTDNTAPVISVPLNTNVSGTEAAAIPVPAEAGQNAVPKEPTMPSPNATNAATAAPAFHPEVSETAKTVQTENVSTVEQTVTDSKSAASSVYADKEDFSQILNAAIKEQSGTTKQTTVSASADTKNADRQSPVTGKTGNVPQNAAGTATPADDFVVQAGKEIYAKAQAESSPVQTNTADAATKSAGQPEYPATAWANAEAKTNASQKVNDGAGINAKPVLNQTDIAPQTTDNEPVLNAPQQANDDAIKNAQPKTNQPNAAMRDAANESAPIINKEFKQANLSEAEPQTAKASVATETLPQTEKPFASATATEINQSTEKVAENAVNSQGKAQSNLSINENDLPADIKQPVENEKNTTGLPLNQFPTPAKLDNSVDAGAMAQKPAGNAAQPENKAGNIETANNETVETSVPVTNTDPVISQQVSDTAKSRVTSDSQKTVDASDVKTDNILANDEKMAPAVPVTKETVSADGAVKQQTIEMPGVSGQTVPGKAPKTVRNAKVDTEKMDDSTTTAKVKETFPETAQLRKDDAQRNITENVKSTLHDNAEKTVESRANADATAPVAAKENTQPAAKPEPVESKGMTSPEKTQSHTASDLSGGLNQNDGKQKDSSDKNASAQSASVNKAAASEPTDAAKAQAEDTSSSRKEEVSHANNTQSNTTEQTAGSKESVFSQVADIKPKTQTASVDAKQSPAETVYKNLKPAEILHELHATILSQDKQRVVYNLEPESLGKMRLLLETTQNSVSAHIEVESEAARKSVEANLPQLRQSLQQDGMQNVAIQVSLKNQDQKQPRNGSQRKGAQTVGQPSFEDEEEQTAEKRLGYNTYEYLA